MLPPHQPGDGCLKDCLESCLEDYLEDNFEDRLDSFLENCLERHLGGCLGGQLESYKIYSKPHIYAAGSKTKILQLYGGRKRQSGKWYTLAVAIVESLL